MISIVFDAPELPRVIICLDLASIKSFLCSGSVFVVEGASGEERETKIGKGLFKVFGALLGF